MNKKSYIELAKAFGGHLDMAGRLYWTSKNDLDIFINYIKKRF